MRAIAFYIHPMSESMSVDALVNYACDRRLQQDFPEAIAACKKAILIESDRGDLYELLGRFLQDLDAKEAAIRAYSRAIALQPNSVETGEAYFQRGNILQATGEVEKAIADYQRVLQFKANLPYTYWNLAEALQKLQRNDEALSCYQKALEADPNAFPAEKHYDIASRQVKRGNIDAAIRLYEWGLAIEANQSNTGDRDMLWRQYYNFGILCRKQKYLDRAIAAYRKALELNPTPWIYFSLGNALFEKQDFQSAAACFQKVVDIHPDRIEAYQNRGNCLQHLQQYDAAIDCYLQVLSVRPQYIRTYKALAIALQDKGEQEQALTCLQYQLPAPLEATLDRIKKQRYENGDRLRDRASVRYTAIHPHQSIVLDPPKTIEPELHVTFKLNRREIPKTCVAQVSNARAVFDFDTTVFDAENKIVEEVSTACLYEKISADKIANLPYYSETVAFLCLRSSENYFHWLFDCLPRIELLRLAGIKLEAIDRFFFIAQNSAYQISTLELLNIPKDKLLRHPTQCHFRADRLYIPSVLGKVDSVPTPWQCDFLKRSFLPFATVKSRSRIYLSRRSTPYRRVLNEDRVVEFLTPFGFQIIYPERLSFIEQVSVMASADVVILPHGAGATNTVFCNPGTKIIEIFAPKYVEDFYWTIALQCHLDYYYFLGEDPQQYYREHNIQPPHYLAAYCEDIVVDLKKLAAVLDFAGVSVRY